MKPSRWNLVQLGIVFVYSTSFALLTGDDQRNFLAIAIALASPLLIITRGVDVSKFSKTGAFLFYLLLVNLANKETVVWSSFLYTCWLCSLFLLFVMINDISLNQLNNIFKLCVGILSGFAIIGVIQWAMLVLEVEPINRILTQGTFRQNLLSVEPAHAGLTVCMILVLANYLCDNLKLNPGSRQICYILTAIAVIFSGSVLAYMLFGFVLLTTLKSWKYVLGFLFLFGVALDRADIVLVERLYYFLLAVPTLDISEIVQADHSGSIRIQPLLIYFRDVEFGSPSFWFGSGTSSTIKFLYQKVLGAPDESACGFIPGILIDYGVTGLMLFIWLIFPLSIFRASFSFSLTLVLFISTHWFNSQIFWLALMIAHVIGSAHKKWFRELNCRV